MGPASQFRPIQPAPVRGARSGSSGSGWLSAKGLTKRLKAVTQACQTCRRHKAKCDGVRPTCGGCTARAAQCRYDGEAGQSRQAALRARLQSLEEFVNDLQSKPDADAERLFQSLRSGQRDRLPRLGSTDSEGQSAEGTTIGSASTCSMSLSSGRSLGSSPEANDASQPDQASASATRVSSLGEVQRKGAEDLPYLLQLEIPLPSAQTTWAGVQSFFSSCGRLFHIFSPQQMETLYRTVFGIDGKPDTSQKLAICCLYAVAAVGIQYNPGDFKAGLEKTFHNASRRFFSEVMEERVLDTIKVCTLFALYNILDKATVALAYVEVGLSLSKRQSQNTGVCHPSMVSAEEWIDFRRTWRALLFFSSWLSSTLGYISGADDSEFTKLLPIAEQDDDAYNAEIGELVQAEMTKLSLLKAGILRNRLAVQELTTLGMDGIIRELQDWHGQLPECMQLRSLYSYDWPPLVRWSIYYLHLLYHGAFMLVYRRIAAHCVRLRLTNGSLTSASQEPTLISLVEQGLMSANSTARIVSLLLDDQGIFRRCWIVIFQAHTACVVILHAVAQKQLHRFPPSSWADDMKRAQQCIDVLGYCGAVDPVALRFRVRLSGIYTKLANFSSGADPMMQRVEDWVDQSSSAEAANNASTELPHPVEYLFTTPPDPNPTLLNLSYSLLFALCRPWSDILSSNVSIAATTAAAGGDAGAGGDAKMGDAEQSSRLLENIGWDFGKVTPFRWDTDGMGMLRDGEVVEQSCFLDSEAPSGWTGAEDLEMDGDGEGSGEGSGVGEERRSGSLGVGQAAREGVAV